MIQRLTEASHARKDQKKDAGKIRSRRSSGNCSQSSHKRKMGSNVGISTSQKQQRMDGSQRRSNHEKKPAEENKNPNRAEQEDERSRSGHNRFGFKLIDEQGNLRKSVKN